MNLVGPSFEIAYRHEQLQRIGVRRRATSLTRRLRRSWFARRRTITSEASAPPAVSTPTETSVGSSAWHDGTGRYTSMPIRTS
jgi:hypothetical protein